uniref:Uncharacterized protein n=1 Tax=Meloidogyne enterolobii TaxID=390850 RepID=A0A6V7XKP7_MELEN|nr:unnamed protein product [Meloidogyne enterolobii]
MSLLTIHNCANMATVDLRERRRQKILQNAEKRLSTILKGPDGSENRQAPCMDGFASLNDEERSEGDVEKHEDVQTINLPIVKPNHCGFVDQNRFWIMIALGLFFRLAVMFELLNYVFLSFTTIFFSWELLVTFSNRTLFRRYPKNDFLVNMLMVTGLNERLVVWTQFIFNLLLEFTMDACVMSFSFICFHLLFITCKYLTESGCCS